MEPYGEAAWAYRAAGWLGVLPLPSGAKWPPPGGFTGWAGVDPSGADVQAWCDGPQRAGNIALRLPHGVYGLDVDDYGGKTGGAALTRLVDALGPLPPTWIVSSRDASVSGIRLFRATLAPGWRWRNEPAGHGEGIESIHFGHRYAVVWPSIHPETGRKYVWRRPDGSPAADGELPRVDGLPELPVDWGTTLAELGEIRMGEVAGHAETVERVTGWRDGEPCTRVREAHARALAALAAAADGAPLHPAIITATHELASLGHEGHVGVRFALAEHYVAATEVRRLRGDEPGKAEAEWWRAVRGAVGKLAGPACEACDCDLWNGAGLLFDPLEQSYSSVTNLEVGSEANAITPDAAPVAPAANPTRRVDLRPWLNGLYAPPEPSIGALRDDGLKLLYPGRWHTVIGPTAAGKSWLALAHARDEILTAKRTVVYLHFEESLPGGMIARLLALDVPRDAVAERFVWLDCDRMWERGELAAELSGIAPGLVVLDGVNAACTRHGFDPSTVEAVGWYRDRFVSPAVALGAAVLSLGHPPKARDRQDERHGYGSTAWLDECDGVGFRLVAARGGPIRRGGVGRASLHSVKDRYGSVERLGRPDERDGWVYLGSLVVDDVGERTTVRVSAPEPMLDVQGAPRDAADELAERVVAHLTEIPGQRYESENKLGRMLRDVRIRHTERDLATALDRLERDGRLVRAPDVPRRSRAGWLPEDQLTASESDHESVV